MNKFIGTKEVKARPLNLGAYNALRGWEMPANENPLAQGYLVEYLDSPNKNHPDYDNYISWSPKDVFERSYRRNETLTFGQAVEAAKQGKAIARLGWNGKAMFVFIRPHDNIDITVIPKIKSLPQKVKDYMIKDFANGETHFHSGNPIQVHFTSYFCLKDPQGNISNGWNASTPDILAEDWVVLD